MLSEFRHLNNSRQMITITHRVVPCSGIAILISVAFIVLSSFLQLVTLTSVIRAMGRLGTTDVISMK